MNQESLHSVVFYASARQENTHVPICQMDLFTIIKYWRDKQMKTFYSVSQKVDEAKKCSFRLIPVQKVKGWNRRTVL